MLETIRDHFIICGYGRIGSTSCGSFGARVPFVVVSAIRPAVSRRWTTGRLAIEADASREDVLRNRVGIERARGLIAVVGTDAENVYAVLARTCCNPTLTSWASRDRGCTRS